MENIAYLLMTVAGSVVLGFVILAVIVMDKLTYGRPPGLFKGSAWQKLRKLWT